MKLSRARGPRALEVDWTVRASREPDELRDGMQRAATSPGRLGDGRRVGFPAEFGFVSQKCVVSLTIFRIMAFGSEPFTVWAWFKSG